MYTVSWLGSGDFIFQIRLKVNTKICTVEMCKEKCLISFDTTCHDKLQSLIYSKIFSLLQEFVVHLLLEVEHIYFLKQV